MSEKQQQKLQAGRDGLPSLTVSAAHHPTTTPTITTDSDRLSPQSLHLDPDHRDRDLESDGAQDADGGKDFAAAPPADAPRLGQEGFWSPRLKKQRLEYLKVISMTTLMICVLVWGAVSIYWGSLWKEYDLSTNLTGWIINRDVGGTVGDFLQDAMLAANDAPKPHVTWSVIDPARYPTYAEIDHQVAVQLSTYIVVEVSANATARLEQARAIGDASWDPTSVVSLTYATARNAQVVPSLVISPAQTALNGALAELAGRLAAEFFSNPPAGVGALVAAAPQTVASPIVVRSRDLRPYDTPVAIAVLFVGLIYLTILAFNITMANFGARQPFQPFLRLPSLVAMRILVPLSAYAIISLMVTLLNVAFDLPYGRTFTYGAGFMIWWCTTFVGMSVLGLVTETFISLAGPKFIGFLLLFFIIINVSVANFPIEVSPDFYRYGHAMPFYNLRLIYNVVIFDVGRHIDILKYFGILWAWLAVIFMTFPIWIWLERRSANKARAAGKGPGGPPH